MRSRFQGRADRGDTLIELVIAIAILGICVVAIGSGVAASVVVSGIHRHQADASRIIHNYAEQLESHAYVNCGGAGDYGLSTRPGWQAPAVTIRYWNTTTFVASCPSPDQGLQQVKITLTDTDGRVSQSLSLVLRRPT